MNLYNAPGLHCVGQISHPKVNAGQPVPVFEPVASKDRPDINTMEGWNALADSVNRKSFVHAFGREPIDRDELYEWVARMCEEAEANAQSVF